MAWSLPGVGGCGGAIRSRDRPSVPAIAARGTRPGHLTVPEAVDTVVVDGYRARLGPFSVVWQVTGVYGLFRR
jgi:hypothetical protein